MNNSIFHGTITNIKRSGWRAYAIVFMMTSTFLVLGVLLTVLYISQTLAGYFMQKPEVIGFFNDEVTEEQILETKRNLESMDIVAEVKYVSKEMAMQSFLQDSKDNQEIIEGVTANVFPAHLNVKAVSLDKIAEVADYFKSNPMISDVLAAESVISTLEKIVIGIQVFGGLLLMIFTFSTIFIIFMAIGITVYSQKNEIIVMKLVGANNWYVRAPYIYQGIFFTLISIVISSAILIPILLTQYESIMYVGLGGLNIANMTWQIILTGLGVEIVFGILLSTLSSYFATRRYINY